MKRLLFLGFATAAALAPFGASAGQRTMIREFTGLDCTTNQDTSIHAKPDIASPAVAKLPDMTPVKILGGKQFGRFVAFPNTDAEFARTWLRLRTRDGQTGWTPSGAINCGG
jgi:hypothetical protein